MEIEEDDPALQIKEEIIMMYNQRLDERIARKEFLIQRNLLLDNSKRFKNKEEKDLYNNLKIYQRFT